MNKPEVYYMNGNKVYLADEVADWINVLQNKLDSAEVTAYDLANILSSLNLADVQLREYVESMREKYKGERK